MTVAALAKRIEAINWPAVATELDAQGWAVVPKLFVGAECDTTAGYYAGGGEAFRSQNAKAGPR